MEILTVKHSHSIFLLGGSMFHLLLRNFLKDTKDYASLVRTSHPKKRAKLNGTKQQMTWFVWLIKSLLFLWLILNPVSARHIGKKLSMLIKLEHVTQYSRCLSRHLDIQTCCMDKDLKILATTCETGDFFTPFSRMDIHENVNEECKMLHEYLPSKFFQEVRTMFEKNSSNGNIRMCFHSFLFLIVNFLQNLL